MMAILKSRLAAHFTGQWSFGSISRLHNQRSKQGMSMNPDNVKVTHQPADTVTISLIYSALSWRSFQSRSEVNAVNDDDNVRSSQQLSSLPIPADCRFHYPTLMSFIAHIVAPPTHC